MSSASSPKGRPRQQIDDELDPLRAHLSGKRAQPRFDITHPVIARCRNGEYAGETVDLSEGGVMIRLDRDAMIKAVGSDKGLGFLQWIHDEFDGGFDLVFPKHGVVLETTMLRLATRAGQVDGLFLGCRFVHPLSLDQRRRLGLGQFIEREDAPISSLGALQELPLHTRRGALLQVMVFAVDDPSAAGPRYIGRIRGLGDCMFAVELSAQSEADVQKRIGTRPLTLRIVHAGQEIWSSRGQLVAAQYLDRDGGMVAAGLLAEHKPPRRLRKRFFERQKKAKSKK